MHLTLLATLLHFGLWGAAVAGAISGTLRTSVLDRANSRLLGAPSYLHQRLELAWLVAPALALTIAGTLASITARSWLEFAVEGLLYSCLAIVAAWLLNRSVFESLHAQLLGKGRVLARAATPTASAFDIHADGHS